MNDHGKELATPLSVTLGPDKLVYNPNPFATALLISGSIDSPCYGFDWTEQKYPNAEYPYSVYDPHWEIDSGPNCLRTIVFAPKVGYAGKGNLRKSLIVTVHPRFSRGEYTVEVYDPETDGWLSCPSTKYNRQNHVVELPEPLPQNSTTVPLTDQQARSVEAKYRILKTGVPKLSITTETKFEFQENPRSPVQATLTVKEAK